MKCAGCGVEITEENISKGLRYWCRIENMCSECGIKEVKSAFGALS